MMKMLRKLIMLKTIVDISIITVCATIILGILTFIDMFRYEFTEQMNQIIRYDRLTNTQCISSYNGADLAATYPLEGLYRDSRSVLPCFMANDGR